MSAPLSFRVIVLICCACVAVLANEPQLTTGKLRLEPAEPQLLSLPKFHAIWHLSPALANQLESALSSLGFRSNIIGELSARIDRSGQNGECIIIPDATLLDLFTPRERKIWYTLLATHSANRTYRWPVSLNLTELSALLNDHEIEAFSHQIKKWGIQNGERFIFYDLFLLESSLTSSSQRNQLFRSLLGTETSVVKFKPRETSEQSSAEQASYWMVNGRYQAIQPFINAVAQVEERDRIDIAHILPRRARAALYSYPDEFSPSADPAIDSAIMAAGFFDGTTDAKTIIGDDIVTFLSKETSVGDQYSRQYGDIVVFDDGSGSRWPYCAVYIADGIVFGRRPTLFGPWAFMRIEDVASINPRLSKSPIFHRRNCPPAGPVKSHATFPAWVDKVKFSEPIVGPWGTLRYYSVLLAPPADMLDRLPAPDPKPIWRFRRLNIDGVVDEIDRLDLPSSEKEELRQLFHQSRRSRSNIVEIYPSENLIWSLASTARSRLYRHLVHGGSAVDYSQEIFLPMRESPDSWFSPGTIPESLRKTIIKLAYSRGAGWMISDYGALFHSASTPTSRSQLLRATFRTPALVVLLEKPNQESVAEISEYWRINQRKSSEALIKSLSENDSVSYLDIVHLVPTLPRELTNTYLLARADDPTVSCYWTAFNFSSSTPDMRALITPSREGNEGREAWAILEKEYKRIDAPSKLGDVVVYRRKGEKFVIHACSYIAGNIVYTKNGFGFNAPWCFMKTEDVDLYYMIDDNIERIYFRKNTSSATD
mgnify:CR=1 FL=1|jgi:hypothetical protein